MLYGPLKIMQTYNCAACPHRSHGIDPIDCLTRMAKWSHGAGIKEGKTDRQQFIVATQVGGKSYSSQSKINQRQYTVATQVGGKSYSNQSKINQRQYT